MKSLFDRDQDWTPYYFGFKLLIHLPSSIFLRRKKNKENRDAKLIRIQEEVPVIETELII